jgi:hypothetical protein
MKKEWIANVFFAALVSATYYVLQNAFENAHVLSSRASAYAALASGLIVGIGLRFAVTATPLLIPCVRRWLLPACAIEGKWLEIIQRPGAEGYRYSIVDFDYNPASEIDPFKMVGHSFYSNGVERLEWNTKYLKVDFKDSPSIEYIYRVTRFGTAYGYGEAWYSPEKPLRHGNGYYLGTEEGPVERFTYILRRIDDSYKQLVGFDPKVDLNEHTNLGPFVRHIHTYYLRNPPAFPPP